MIERFGSAILQCPCCKKAKLELLYVVDAKGNRKEVLREQTLVLDGWFLAYLFGNVDQTCLCRQAGVIEEVCLVHTTVAS